VSSFPPPPAPHQQDPHVHRDQPVGAHTTYTITRMTHIHLSNIQRLSVNTNFTTMKPRKIHPNSRKHSLQCATTSPKTIAARAAKFHSLTASWGDQTLPWPMSSLFPFPLPTRYHCTMGLGTRPGRQTLGTRWPPPNGFPNRFPNGSSFRPGEEFWNWCFHLIICTRHVRVLDFVSFRSVPFKVPVPELYAYSSGTWKLKLAKLKVEGTRTVGSI